MPSELEMLDISEESRGSRARADVYSLPYYYEAGSRAKRTDINSGRIKIGSVYDAHDLEAAARKFATEPGAYYVELRQGVT